MIGWLLVALALAVAGTVGVLAARRPILFRMAARNALRRPKQTATVIAGLMIGTAIISAALVAGQSTTSAVREAVYDALGEVDEAMRLEGFQFYPDTVLEEALADPDVAYFDAVAPNVVWEATADNPRTDLYEPSVSLLGFDPVRDRAFGDFHLQGGGRHDGTGLAADHAIASAQLAQALELRVGDTLRLGYTQPVDPLLPTLEAFGGTLGPSLDPGALVPLLPGQSLGTGADHSFAAPDGAVRMVFVLLCGGEAGPCPAGSALSLTATAPDGTVYQAAQEAPGPGCLPGAPTGPVCPPRPNPLWLNVTSTADRPLGGTWDLHVAGTLAAQAPYTLVAVALEPVYDLEELQRRSAALESLDTQGFADLVDAAFGGAPREMELRVVAITDGGRGDQFDLGPSLFLRLDTLQERLGREGEINYIKFSNPGGVRSGADHTDRAAAILNATLADIQGRHPGVASIQNLQVKTIKQDFLEVADQAGQTMTSLLIFAGSLTVITGLLLIINIFTMLAEERRSELGMARAVGLSQRDLVRLFLFEGSLYAVVAALLGALLGLLLAFGLIQGLNAILAEQRGDFPPIPFHPSPEAVPIAFATGALLTFATIFVASRRQAGLNIVRAIRQIDEPQRGGAHWMLWVGAPVAVLGIAATTTGWIVSALPEATRMDIPHFSLRILGALAIAAGAMLMLRPMFRRKTVDMSVAALLAAYYVTTIYTISTFDDINEANIVGPVRGVIMTLCLVVLVAYWETGPRLLGRAMAKVRRLRAIAVPAVSYPQHKRFRTGMTLAMFAIVVLSIGFFSIFGALFEVDAARHTGGFEVEGRTTLLVDGLAASDRGLLDPDAVRSVHHVDDFSSFLPGFITVDGERTGQFGPPQHHVYGIDEAFVAAQEFKLLWTLDGMSDDEAYQRLFTDPDAIIVGYPYSTNERNQDLSHKVGETLTLHIGDCTDPVDGSGTGGPCPTFTIVGIQEQYHFPGVWLPKATTDLLFPQSRDLFLYDLAPGTDAVAFAKDLERNHRDVGMDAEASQELVKQEQEAFRQILGAMKLFLGLGLIVGVLSLGIITSRSVLERRQEIGMLRALGYTTRMVRRIFFIEVTLIILMGALLGILSSIIVTYGLWVAIIRELQYPYVVPWGEIGLLLLVAYVVALVATAAPILRAARTQPAEALRYIE